MTEPMALTVNGQPHAMADGSTVSQLLDTLQIKPERVVVEVNLKILKRHEHHDVRLRSGDQVEIVRFVGGGAVDGTALERVGSRQVSEVFRLRSMGAWQRSNS